MVIAVIHKYRMLAFERKNQAPMLVYPDGPMAVSDRPEGHGIASRVNACRLDFLLRQGGQVEGAIVWRGLL